MNDLFSTGDLKESQGQQEPLATDARVDRLIRQDEDVHLRATRTRRYSRFVRSLRLTLPIVALAIVVVLMVWSDRDTQIKAIPRADISPQTVTRNELINPKFQSEDTDSQPYTITADKATQSTSNMDNILLDKPVADISLKGGNWLAIKATEGEYNQKSGVLKLDGSVQMNHDTGYELQSDHMNIDVGQQMVTSDVAVTGHGPAAEISAQGLEADGKTDTVIFKGPATLVLRQTSNSEHVKQPAAQDPVMEQKTK